jgi:hypothetical protein
VADALVLEQRQESRSAGDVVHATPWLDGSRLLSR